jgi:hypothetical protein
VVAKTILEVVGNKRTQRITLVLTLLLKHVWASEDVTIELLALDKAKLTIGAVYKILSYADVIEQVPRVLICQRTQASL